MSRKRLAGFNLRIGDIILLAILVGAGVAWFGINWAAQGGTTAHDDRNYEFVVILNGKEHYRGPLQRSEEIQQVIIPLDSVGSDSEAVLEIANGMVRVLPMPLALCPKQICCHFTPPISRPKQVIACVPNKMIIKIESEQDGEMYDALTG